MKDRMHDVAYIAVNGTLYALVGYLTYLGIFAPAIGVVRFWPSVVIPALFSYLFGPLVGGAGAALGIFISDMLIHGNAILSLTVGVPANFIAFYTLGLLSRTGRKSIFYGIFFQLIPVLATLALYYNKQLDKTVVLVFASVCIFSVLLSLVLSLLKPELRGFFAAASAALIIGSSIIGLGVWAFSQFFILPSGEKGLPVIAALMWFVWTYATEIPFLLFLTPPLIAAVGTALGMRDLFEGEERA